MKQCFLDKERECEESCMAFISEQDSPMCSIIVSLRVLTTTAISVVNEGVKVREPKKKDVTHHPKSAPPPEVKVL